MDLIFNESTQMWEEKKEPVAVIEVGMERKNKHKAQGHFPLDAASRTAGGEMMGKNAYAAKLQAQRDAREYIIKLWMGQLMMDVFGITLADEEVMGKDTFGEKRLARIETAINQRISEVMPALTGGPEADYIRAKVDQRLKQIKPDTLPWSERYEGWTERGLQN